jgi:hypothetical protein
MNEPGLRDLLTEAAEKVTAPDLAEVVWARARRTRRRRQVGALALAIAGVAATALLLPRVGDRTGDVTHRVPGPSPSTPGPTTPPPPSEPPETPGSPPGVDPSIMQEVWTPSRSDSLAWLPSLLPHSLNPTAQGSTPLSTDPLNRAVAAVQEPDPGAHVYVLGDDGRWRVLDIVDLVDARDAGGNGGPAMRPSALSPDGTRLAIPQPQALVVVDLTAARYRRYQLPGFNETATWAADGTHVLLGTEERRDGVLVDLADGSTTTVPYHPQDTAYAPDGTAVELWQRPNDLPPYRLKRYGPSGLMESKPLDVDAQNGWYHIIISVDVEAIAMVREVNGWSGPRGPEEWGGALVLDLHSGEPLAELPVHDTGVLFDTTPLGWLDSDTLVVRLKNDVVAWDYKTGELERITQLPHREWTLSIAAGFIR